MTEQYNQVCEWHGDLAIHLLWWPVGFVDKHVYDGIGVLNYMEKEMSRMSGIPKDMFGPKTSTSLLLLDMSKKVPRLD
jgi:hypothetical protein